MDDVAGDEALFAQFFSCKIASQTMEMHTQATGIFLFVSSCQKTGDDLRRTLEVRFYDAQKQVKKSGAENS